MEPTKYTLVILSFILISVVFSAPVENWEKITENEIVKSSCPVKFKMDRDFNRDPSHIPRYFCQKVGTKCSSCDVRSVCHQLYIFMNVTIDGNTRARKFEAGCVCKRNTSAKTAKPVIINHST